MGDWCSSRKMIPFLGVMLDAVPEVAHAPSMHPTEVWPLTSDRSMASRRHGELK